VENALSCNVEESFKKFLDADPDAGNLQQLINFFLSTDAISSFYAKLLTDIQTNKFRDRQTDKQTNKRRVLHYFIGGGTNCKVRAPSSGIHFYTHCCSRNPGTAVENAGLQFLNDLQRRISQVPNRSETRSVNLSQWTIVPWK